MSDDLVEELRDKVVQQQEEIERLTSALSTTSHGDLEAKYLEAMRKLKSTSVKLESEKTKNNKMTHQLIDMERRLIESERLNQSALPAQTHVQSEGSDTSSPTSRSPKEMKEKISQLQRTNAELKHQVATQKTEIKKMKEIIKREVGEQATDLLSTIHSTSDSEGWRGRSQTISLLKSRLKEAQRRLSATSVPSELGGTTNRCSAVANTTIAPSDSASRAADGAGCASVVDFDERHRSTISEVSSARRAKTIQLTEVNKQLEATLTDKSSKLSASNARITVLENELTAFRMQLARVIQKTENDDKLLHAYKTELEGKRVQLKEATSTAKGGFNATITQMTEAAGEQTVDHSEQITRLEKEIESLRATLSNNVPGDEYSQLLKRQVDEYRLKYEHIEGILHKERAAAKTSTVPPSTDANPTSDKIPQEALVQMSLLKSEVTSLKDRISLMKSNHEAEVFTVNRISSEKLSQMTEENNDLRVQYQKMKVALSEALDNNNNDNNNNTSGSGSDVTPSFTPTPPPQQDGPAPDSD